MTVRVTPRILSALARAKDSRRIAECVAETPRIPFGGMTPRARANYDAQSDLDDLRSLILRGGVETGDTVLVDLSYRQGWSLRPAKVEMATVVEWSSCGDDYTFVVEWTEYCDCNRPCCSGSAKHSAEIGLDRMEWVEADGITYCETGDIW